MKKILLTLFIISATYIAGYSQTIESFAMVPEVGLATGVASNYYTYTAGFSVKFEFATKLKALKFVASGGYTDFVAKSSIKNGAEADYLPVDIGLKYYFHRVYIEAEGGGSVNLDGGYPGPRFAFIYAPTIGFTVPALDFDELDFGIGYQNRVETDRTISQAVLHVAYKFNL